MRRKTYVKFVDAGLSHGKPSVEVQTLHDEALGGIAWYGRWSQYVFIPEEMTVFSFDCLEDIATQVKAMNETAR